MAFNIDKTPIDNFERQMLKEIIFNQTREINAAWSVKVTCPCGKGLSVLLAIKCLQCSVFFCPDCAQRHFQVEDITAQ